LYAVELKDTGSPIGMCGFVRRDTLPGPDIGFAFLPEFEGRGFGFESADAVMAFGRDSLHFSRLFAITSKDNEVSGKLLEKLGFKFDKLVTMNNGEELKLFEIHL
jgi:RimJ/RimL family protein N-acetyltransferase